MGLFGDAEGNHSRPFGVCFKVPGLPDREVAGALKQPWDPVIKKQVNRNLRGLIASAAVAALAPFLGLGLTLVSLLRSFRHTAVVDPSEKARVLAAGISSSMTATAVGIAVSGLAFVTMIVFAVRLYRDSKRGGSAR